MGRYDWEKKRDQRAQPKKKPGLTGTSVLLGIVAVGSVGAAFTFSRSEEKYQVDSEASALSEPRVLNRVGDLNRVSKTETADASSITTPKINVSGPTTTFAKCGAERITCVVDGDTFWFNGEKIRIADIDTPEVSQPKCSEELALGIKATDRLIALLNDGPFELAAADRDRDSFGRQLRIVIRNGKSLGDQLVDEGLAHRWDGGKKPWC